MLVARQGAQALDELDAIHVRHHVVDQHQVGNVPRRPDHRVDGAREPFNPDALVDAAHHLLENSPPDWSSTTMTVLGANGRALI